MSITSLLSKFATFGDVCDPTAGSNNFLTLTPWYQYLEGAEDSFGKCVPQISNSAGDGLPGVWLILLAVIDSLLKIVALVAVGFIIYGGVQFVISQGEPDKTNQARNTIINALVGLVIAMAAASIVSFIGRRVS